MISVEVIMLISRERGTDDMETKIEPLKTIYHEFEKQTAAYKKGAACEQGCAYCCKDAGNIDITTLEGLIIRDKIKKMQRSRQATLKKALAKDMKKRNAGEASICPFLMKTSACMIYEIRPFSCRRIYSVHRCDSTHPPALSRQVMDIANQSINALQQLDDSGYSGHISCILHMLDAPRFLSTYLAGDYKPEEVVAFGKTYKIVINRMVS